jgi:hypothetical protein
VGIIGRVIKHNIEKLAEIVSETRKDFNQNALLYTPAGDDSIPLKDERLILIKVDGNGKYIACGVLTPSQGAKPGEKIFFARDPDGATVSKIFMLNDGSVNTEADGDIMSATKKNVNYSAKENFDVKADKNITMEAAAKATVKGDDVEINGKAKATGGSFECAGTVAPTGQGALCGCKYCYVTAFPVAGSKAEGT